MSLLPTKHITNLQRVMYTGITLVLLAFMLASPFSACAQSPLKENLLPLLPQKIDEMIQSEAVVAAKHNGISIIYRSADSNDNNGHSLKIKLSYDNAFQDWFQKHLLPRLQDRSESFSTTTIGGQTIYMLVDDEKAGAFALPGNIMMKAKLNPEKLTGSEDAALKTEFTKLLQDLDWERLSEARFPSLDITDPVDTKTLFAVLPKNLDGLELDGHMQMSLPGMTVALRMYGTAQHGREYNPSSIKIKDTGSYPITAKDKYSWVTQDINHKTDNGYEKTTTYHGYRSRIKYSNGEVPRGRIDLLITDRFHLQARGKAVTMERLKKALAQVRHQGT